MNASQLAASAPVAAQASATDVCVPYGPEPGYQYDPNTLMDAFQKEGTWHARLDLSSLLGASDVKFFYPFTTTLVELRLNREPLPLTGTNYVCRFID
ncbi:hypothetical protein [Paenibacillus glycinis]|uniref:Uncharacterized protein n=1 Tax=Paenibacillus glycinis TaxID=2697035 RepID=A0ABW9XM90_9BACL|nr:hypothetical protein [Paenibacillus glycinis]NBD23752.1 hypothetical protein [Paenibacillus glycinis]